MVNESEEKFKENVEELGFEVLKKGYPDFLVLPSGDSKIKFPYFVEVKSDSPELRKSQKKMKEKIENELGVPVLISVDGDFVAPGVEKFDDTKIGKDFTREISEIERDISWFADLIESMPRSLDNFTSKEEFENLYQDLEEKEEEIKKKKYEIVKLEENLDSHLEHLDSKFTSIKIRGVSYIEDLIETINDLRKDLNGNKRVGTYNVEKSLNNCFDMIRRVSHLLEELEKNVENELKRVEEVEIESKINNLKNSNRKTLTSNFESKSNGVSGDEEKKETEIPSSFERKETGEIIWEVGEKDTWRLEN